MRKLRLIFFISLTALSLLLCSLTLVAWLSGRSEMVWIGRADHYAFEIGWHDGRIFAGDITITYTTPAGGRDSH